MDKILTEAFDKLKAIEESDDPFCIGAKKEGRNETYTEVKEDDYEDPMAGRGSDEYSRNDGEEPNARVEPKTYEITTDSGEHYAIYFEHFGDSKGEITAFIEANGITVANFTVGGAGAMNARIQKPDELMNIVAEALKAANGTGM